MGCWLVRDLISRVLASSRFDFEGAGRFEIVLRRLRNKSAKAFIERLRKKSESYVKMVPAPRQKVG